MGFFEAALGVLSLLAYILGSILLAVILISAIIILFILLLLAYSFRTGNILFPNLMVTGIVFFESPIRTILRILKVDDTKMDLIGIRLRNRAMYMPFSKVPFNRRAIFLPQCLRSITCPAVLSPEGIKCRDCGACGISKAHREAERLGYRFFVVPGSSFIMRMIQKYRPEAIIGVGCLYEVRDGLDMMHSNRIPAIGVMLDHSGCVGTQLDWEKLFAVMNSSIDSDREKKGAQVPDEFSGNTNPSR